MKDGLFVDVAFIAFMPGALRTYFIYEQGTSATLTIKSELLQ